MRRTAPLVVVAVLYLTMASLRYPTATAQPPADRYATAEHLEGTALRAALHEIVVTGHHKANGATIVEMLEAGDEHPDNTSQVLDIYLNAALNKRETPRRPWQIEHAWPESRGFASSKIGTDCNLPVADAHHLFVAAPLANGPAGHGNRFYADCQPRSACSEVPVTSTPSASNWRSSETWEVWPRRRGDIARALFYMDVRYDGGDSKVERRARDSGGGEGVWCVEHELTLTDNPTEIATTSSETGPAAMGLLSVLLRWNLEDPVDERDRQHNDAVAAGQGNRNPFTDRPDFVCRVYSIGICATWAPRVWLPWLSGSR